MIDHENQTTIHISTDFSTVYLLNGTFSENADSFLYPAATPLYITVLPLSAHLLPYTVKTLGAKCLENENLCAAFSADGAIHIKLLPRYNYIYTAQKQGITANASIPEKFFYAVKQNNLDLAKKYMSIGLTETIDNESLTAFFNDYTAIIKSTNQSKNPHQQGEGFYLINEERQGTLFNFEMFDGLIDNISN